MQANQRRRLRLRLEEFDQLARTAFDVSTDYGVAVKLGVHPASLSLVRNGRVQPSERFIVAALDALGCRFEDIFEIVDSTRAECAA